MQSIQQPVVRRPAVALVMSEDMVSVRPETPVEDVLALLTRHQMCSVPVIDEHRVLVGAISLADLAARGDEDPIFAGLARRLWYRNPDGVTAGDLMSHRTWSAVPAERPAVPATAYPSEQLPAAS